MKNFAQQRTKQNIRSAGPRPALIIGGSLGEDLCCPGYINLEDSPEITAGVLRIAELIGSITIHLMNNTESGDERIVNELSRMIDITPAPGLTRQKFITFVVKTMLLRGRGNAVVLPHTRAGYLKRLEPIAADRVSYIPVGRSDYRVQIDGREYRPNDVLHFTFNPDDIYPWKGKGIKPNAEIRQKLQDVTFMKDKIVAESVGKAYKDTETSVKKDNRLEAALAKLKETFKLDTAPVQLYKSPNQVQNFVECYFSRKPTISPAEVGGRGAVLCQLCNMSYVYDTGFDWDPVKMDFANGTGKGISLKRDFCRNGWEVVV